MNRKLKVSCCKFAFLLTLTTKVDAEPNVVTTETGPVSSTKNPSPNNLQTEITDLLKRLRQMTGAQTKQTEAQQYNELVRAIGATAPTSIMPQPMAKEDEAPSETAKGLLASEADFLKRLEEAKMNVKASGRLEEKTPPLSVEEQIKKYQEELQKYWDLQSNGRQLNEKQRQDFLQAPREISALKGIQANYAETLRSVDKLIERLSASPKNRNLAQVWRDKLGILKAKKDASLLFTDDPSPLGEARFQLGLNLLNAAIRLTNERLDEEAYHATLRKNHSGFQSMFQPRYESFDNKSPISDDTTVRQQGAGFPPRQINEGPLGDDKKRRVFSHDESSIAEPQRRPTVNSASDNP